MLCYQDRTFCSFYKKCKEGNNCAIALTKEIFKCAKKWSNEVVKTDDVLICQFVDKPECFKEI